MKRSSAEQRDEHRKREADDPQPVVGDGDAAEIEGAAHPGRIADFAIVGAERGAHRLLQDQRQAPGRQQRFQRPAIEEADDGALDHDADDAGDQEGERNRDRERIVEQRRIARADHLLHHEGDIGAEHDHFAVRHVDHAHDAEGDGKADGGQQQHRAERNAVPGVLHRFPDREAVLDGADGGGGAGRDRRRESAGMAGQKPERVLIAALADDLDGGELVRVAGFVAGQDDRGARLRERPLDARVLLLRQGGFERRQRAGLARLEHRLRGVEAHPPDRRQAASAAERGVDGAAQPVVDAHIVDIGRRDRRRSAHRWPHRDSLPDLVLDIDRLAFGAVDISWPSCKARRIASARGLPLAATSLMPVAVSLKSSAVKCAQRLVEAGGVRGRKAKRSRLSANSKATRQARRKRIVSRARRKIDAGRRHAASPPVSRDSR